VLEPVHDSAAGPRDPSRPNRLDSRLCRAADLASDRFRYWAEQIREPFRMHRKLWEFCYISQALDERGLLRPGSRGLGFAVGQEQLPALFAARGCRITATDLPRDDSRVKHWESSLQWSSGLAQLNLKGLCPEVEFRRLVEFRGVDMNHIPTDLTGYDFTWSSCSFEHCGDLELGARFLENQMQCLKPGGVAVHTTEFNLTSNETTLDKGVTVIYRRRDIEAMARRLRAAGHEVEPLNFTLGNDPADRHVDLPPYSPDRHLRLALGDWATTSIGLVIRRG
jgi:SAM-dependent methyltransferase